MKVIIFGATGTVGAGVLIECLENLDINAPARGHSNASEITR